MFYSRSRNRWDTSSFCSWALTSSSACFRHTGVFSTSRFGPSNAQTPRRCASRSTELLMTALGSAAGQRHHGVVDRAGDYWYVIDWGQFPPFLVAEVFASNVGGAAVGDPPGDIIIASRAGRRSTTSYPHGPGRARRHDRPDVGLLPTACRLRRTEGRPSCRRCVAQRAPEAIHDRGLLIRDAVRLGAGVCGLHRSSLHIQPSLVALLGAGIARFSGLEAIELPVQRRVGHPAVLRRICHGGAR